MFAEIDADIYVMADGDLTYDAAAAPQLIDLLAHGNLDMVVGARIDDQKAAYRPGHRFGNWLLTGMVRTMFGNEIRDMLSGYRVFSRPFVKSFPAISQGFEVETELTIHSLELNLSIAEVDVLYGVRPENSQSKLRSFRDGFRIIRMIINLVRDERPLQFFSTISAVCFALMLALALPVVLEFIETGLVPRLPTAVLSMGLGLLSILLLSIGLVLDSVARGRREAKWMAYLAAHPRRSALQTGP
jgi:hypothetical protein